MCTRCLDFYVYIQFLLEIDLDFSLERSKINIEFFDLEFDASTSTFYHPAWYVYKTKETNFESVITEKYYIPQSIEDKEKWEVLIDLELQNLKFLRE